MENAFNNLAATYDKEFTFTPTGILQRKQVLSYLQKQIIDKKSLNILELNCGTGEDAVQLAKWGHRIVATDGSKEMIRIAKTKNETPEGLPPLFRELAFDKICRENFEEQFDLVFSNFGGLNCINKHELETLFLHLIPLLKPGGRFIGVVMPRYCLWEIIYFAYKGRW